MNRNIREPVSWRSICIQPGTFCALIFLFRADNGEPILMMRNVDVWKSCIKIKKFKKKKYNIGLFKITGGRRYV
jgi:hypothetical protein